MPAASAQAITRETSVDAPEYQGICDATKMRSRDLHINNTRRQPFLSPTHARSDANISARTVIDVVGTFKKVTDVIYRASIVTTSPSRPPSGFPWRHPGRNLRASRGAMLTPVWCRTCLCPGPAAYIGPHAEVSSRTPTMTTPIPTGALYAGVCPGLTAVERYLHPAYPVTPGEGDPPDHVVTQGIIWPLIGIVSRT